MTITPGGLLLPDPPPRDLKVSFAGDQHAAIRLAITNGLLELNNLLSQFEQTTHGSFFQHGAKIEDVCEIVIALWNGELPEGSKLITKFSWLVSELSQRIEKLK